MLDDLKNISKIAVIQHTGGIVGALAILPSIRAIRCVVPKTKFYMYCSVEAYELLEECPFFEEVLLINEIVEYTDSFDLVLSFDPPDKIYSNILEISGKYKVAWRKMGDLIDERFNIMPVYPASADPVRANLKLLWAIGFPESEVRKGLWPSLSDRNYAAKICEKFVKKIAVVKLKDAPELELEKLLATAGYDVLIIDDQNFDVGVLVGILERASLFIGDEDWTLMIADLLEVLQITLCDPTLVFDHIPEKVTFIDERLDVRESIASAIFNSDRAGLTH